MIGVAVKPDQKLASFKEEVLNKHSLLLTDYTLILIGRELVDDEKTLGDLGFTPGCTVHAGKYYFPLSSLASHRRGLQLRRCNFASRLQLLGISRWQ